MTQDSAGADHTHVTRFRIPCLMWDVFGRVTDRLDTNRTARLLAYIRDDIQAHGNAQDLADLKAAERELTERRARTGGRPRTISR